MIKREWQLFLAALQLLTRIPAGSLPGFQPDWLDRSVKYFPLIGAIVGVLCGLVLTSAFMLLPSPLPAIIAVAAGLLITGAIHEDGLADTADGIGGGRDRSEALDIMKDSTIGTYGAAALLMTLAIKVAAIDSVDARTGIYALISAHAFARLATVIAMAYMPYAGDPERAKVRPKVVKGSADVAIAAVLGILPAAALLNWDTAMAAICIGTLLASVMAIFALRKIGGYTGDVLGAIEQMAEIGFLFAVSAFVAGPFV